jgi:hypothetical protein
MAAALLFVLSRNYVNADAVGRRQLRCVLLGGYLGMLPFAFVGVLAATAPDFAGLRWLHACAIGFVAIGPLGVLVAIARFNLFDIDRLISGTASYTLVLILAALAGETLLEPFVGLLGESAGFDPTSSQIVFVGAMAGVVIPIQRAWRPYVDRLFFSTGLSETEEVERLLEELPSMSTAGADALRALVGERLDAIFEPTSCVVYQLREDEFEPGFVATDAPVHPLSAEDTQVILRALHKRLGPMRLDSRGSSHKDAIPTQSVRAALHSPDVALLVPLRTHGVLDAFLCLGPKHTGDVYTPTELTLLTSVAHHVSDELSAAAEH